MKIRELRSKDFLNLSKLVRKIIKDTPYYSKEAKSKEIKKYSPAAIKDYFSDKKYYTCLVAEEKNELVGFVIGRNEDGVFWPDWLGIEKSMRQKGIAKELMAKLESKLADKSVHKVWCDTRTNNKESNRLLLRLGYKKLGKFRNGWHKQDFFLWEKDLVK